jgi:DNA-binding NtrC family response regulator
MPTASPQTIVVIDDHVEHLHFLEALLRRAGYDAVGFDRATDALRYIEQEQTQIVITDLLMPDMDGIEVLRRLSRRQPPPAVIGVSGSKSYDTTFLLHAMSSLGARAVFSKPIDPAALLDIVCAATAQPRLI